jgi:hypothetical protein
MCGTDLSLTKLQYADIKDANLSGSNLSGAQMQRAKILFTNLEDANLSFTHLQVSTLDSSTIERADLRQARLNHTRIINSDFRFADLTAARLDFSSIQLTRFNGADLTDAKFVNAHLVDNIFDKSAILLRASFVGACSTSTDFSESNISKCQINSMFGDTSNFLPSGKGPDSDAWPEHWPKEKLGKDEFERRWRAWQAKEGYTLNNPTN